MAQSLRSTIESLVPLKEEEWELIDARFFPISLEAGELLLKAGEVCHHLYFSETGLLRFYEWTQEA